MPDKSACTRSWDPERFGCNPEKIPGFAPKKTPRFRIGNRAFQEKICGLTTPPEKLQRPQRDSHQREGAGFGDYTDLHIIQMEESVSTSTREINAEFCGLTSRKAETNVAVYRFGPGVGAGTGAKLNQGIIPSPVTDGTGSGVCIRRQCGFRGHNDNRGIKPCCGLNVAAHTKTEFINNVFTGSSVFH